MAPAVFFCPRNYCLPVVLLIVFLTIEWHLKSVRSSPLPTLLHPDEREGTATMYPGTMGQENRTVALTPSLLQKSNSLLLLYSDGYLSSYNLTTGQIFWDSDTFGDIVTVSIDEPPSEEMTQADPFAQPFFLYGSGLYTVIPLRQCGDLLSSQGSLSKDRDNCSTPLNYKALQRRFFANISTILRRRHFVVGDTDFFVSSDVSILDLDSTTGKIQHSTSSVPFVGKFGSVDPRALGGQGNEKQYYAVLPSIQERDSSQQLPLPSLPILKDPWIPLSPYLHVVRHNIQLNAYRTGKYKWSITIAQLELSERHPFQVERSEEINTEEEHLEKHPRFFSKLIERLLTTSFSFSSDRKAAAKMSCPFSIREVNNTCISLWSRNQERDLWFVRFGRSKCDRRPSTGKFMPFALCERFSSKRVVGAWIWKDGDITRVPIITREEESAIGVLRFLDEENNFEAEKNSSTLLTTEYSSSLPALFSDHYSVAENRKKYHPGELGAMLYAAGHYRTPLLPLYGNRDIDIDEEDYEDIFSHRDSSRLLRAPLEVSDIPFYLFHLIFFFSWCGFLKYGMQFRPNYHRDSPQSQKYRPFLAIQRSRLPFPPYSINPPHLYSVDAPMFTSPLARFISRHCGNVSSAQMSNSELSSSSYNMNNDLYQSSFFSTDCNESPSRTAEGREGSPPGGFSGKLFQHHFIIKKKIGFGGEGSIFLAEHNVTHRQYAIKAVRICNRSEDRVLEEAMLHSSFDHPHVVRYHFCWIEDISSRQAAKLQLFDNSDDGFDSISFDDDEEGSSDTTEEGDNASASWEGSTTASPDVSFIGSQRNKGTHRTLFILMEYFENGTLADALAKRTSVDRIENLHYLQSIAMGLQYLHEHNVMHRDLKPTNIFVTKEKNLRIGDFGLAKRREPIGNSSDLAVVGVSCSKEASTQGGSPLYSSPEQQSNGEVSKLSDIYSLGLVMVELYSHFTTFHERIDVFNKARRRQLSLQFQNEYAEEGKLILKMLEEKPLNRPSAQETLIIISDILKEINKNNLVDSLE